MSADSKTNDPVYPEVKTDTVESFVSKLKSPEDLRTITTAEGATFLYDPQTGSLFMFSGPKTEGN